MTKKNRRNFTSATRKKVADAAGNRCSIRYCLKPLKYLKRESDGAVRIINRSQVSHVYAAAPNGPRPASEDMSNKEIMDESNGILTCRDCGDLIDKVPSKYPPDLLFEMKKIREYATELAASDPVITPLSPYISPIDFDEVLWKYLPDLNIDKIRAEMQCLYQQPPVHPLQTTIHSWATPTCAPNKISLAIKNLSDNPANISTKFRQELMIYNCKNTKKIEEWRRRYKELASQLIKDSMFDINIGESGLLIGTTDFFFTLKSAQIESILESSIEEVGTLYLWHTHDDILNIRIICFLYNFIWTYDDCKSTVESVSRLVMLRDIACKDFARLHGYELREEIDKYERFVKMLIKGLQVVAFARKCMHSFMYRDDIYREPFEINYEIQVSSLEKCLDRVSKISLIADLEVALNINIKCADDLFHPKLELDQIRLIEKKMLCEYSCGGINSLVLLDCNDVRIGFIRVGQHAYEIRKIL